MRELTPLKKGDRGLRSLDINAAYEELERLGHVQLLGGGMTSGPGGIAFSPQEVEAIAIGIPATLATDSDYPTPPDQDADPIRIFPFRLLHSMSYSTDDPTREADKKEGSSQYVHVYNMAGGWVHPDIEPIPVYKWNDRWWVYYDPPRLFELYEHLAEHHFAAAYELFPRGTSTDKCTQLGLIDDDDWRRGGRPVTVQSKSAHIHGRRGYRGIAASNQLGWCMVSIVQKARWIHFKLTQTTSVVGPASNNNCDVLSFWEGIDPRLPSSGDQQVPVRNLFHGTGGSTGTACYTPALDIYHCVDQTCPPAPNSGGGSTHIITS